jgi:thioredoxin reductase
VTATGLPGVFLAGDWVGAEGLLADASLASGMAAALAATGRRPASATMAR